MIFAAILASSLSPRSADADDFPRITGEVVIEIQNDWTFDSDDRDAELNDLFTTTEPDINLFATEELFLNMHLTLEPVVDPKPRQDRFFQDHGLFVENLSVNYETDPFQLIGGKFGPNFSIAYDAAPGIYGTDLSEDDIELSERWGFGGGVSFGDGGLALEEAGIGRHTLSASAFFTDTTFVSKSFLKNRGQTRLGDGGPSNTESLESFVVALDGEDLPQVDGLRYHLAFARQEVDRVLDEDGAAVANIDDEYRAAAALEWAYEVNEDVTVTPLVEYVRFWNATGLGTLDRDYVTAASLFEYRNWNLALAYTGRFTEDDAGTDFDDFQVQVSAGYTFDFGLAADIGWKFSDQEDIETQIFGTFLTYTVEF